MGAAIGMVNSKTTAVRLIPAIGKKQEKSWIFGEFTRKRTDYGSKPKFSRIPLLIVAAEFQLRCKV